MDTQPNRCDAETAVVVDHHPLVQMALCDLLAGRMRFRNVLFAASPAEALHLVELHRPIFLTLDLMYPAATGFDLLRDLRQQFSRVRSLVISGRDESTWAMRSMQLGARGYVMKSAPIDQIIEAMRIVAAGKTYVSPNIGAALFDLSRHARKADPTQVLSRRESEVYQLIGQGLDTHQIAKSLSRSKRTVATYKARIREKLGLNSMTELARHAIEAAI